MIEFQMFKTKKDVGHSPTYEESPTRSTALRAGLKVGAK